MPKINVLEKHVAELIAAGEVVERPCSVVKELVENSIDAGSKSVTIEIKNGGNTYIRVTDDGCGIEKDDIRTAFLRHATSKICLETDLDSIHTFGFRGEALASIAAVAKVDLITRTSGASIGYSCHASDSEIGEVMEAGCPEGTTIVVKDLFYNTPARQKFLKKDLTESNAVGLIVDKIALSHPEVKVKFIKDGEIKLSTYGNGDLLSVISSVSGRDFSESMLSVDYSFPERKGYRVYGYITSPRNTRASRNYQTFFVNMRFVKTNTAMAALEEAFKGSAMVGKFPGCVLFIDIPAESVDVNVHPSKTEVRFQNEKDIFDLVYYGVKSSLKEKDKSFIQTERNTTINSELSKKTYMNGNSCFETMSSKTFQSEFYDNPENSLKITEKKTDIFDTNTYGTSGKILQKKSYYIYPNVDVENNDDSEEDLIINNKNIKTNNAIKDDIKTASEYVQTSLENNCKKELKYIGEAFKTYIILESEDSIILVDKHAAHERILYENLKKGIKAFDSQVLLKPLTVSLPKEQSQAIVDNYEEMSKFGFDCEDFGNGTLLIRSIPIWIKQSEVTDIISEIADSLLTMKHDITPEKLDWLYANMSCRAAIKANDSNSEDELKTIISILSDNTDIKYCPHGRPISTELTKTKLEHMFGRIQ